MYIESFLNRFHSDFAPIIFTWKMLFYTEKIADITEPGRALRAKKVVLYMARNLKMTWCMIRHQRKVYKFATNSKPVFRFRRKFTKLLKKTSPSCKSILKGSLFFTKPFWGFRFRCENGFVWRYFFFSAAEIISWQYISFEKWTKL